MKTRLASKRGVWAGMLWMLLSLLAASGVALGQELVIAAARLQYSLPLYVAESEGYFADEGVKLRIEDCNFGRICLKRLLDGEVPIATVAETPIVLASFSAQSFFILATISESGNDSKLLVRKSAGIKAPRDLAGKRIGTVNGTSSQYLLDAFLIYNGIDRRDVTVVNLMPDRTAAAFEKREIDAVVMFEPHAFAAAKALGADGATLPFGRINRTTFNIVIDRRIAGVRDAQLTGMLRALDRAMRFIQDQPQKAQAILRARLKSEQSFVEATWKDYSYALSLDQSLISILESQARWAAREGYEAGSASPNYLGFIYSGPLSKVRPAAVSIVK